MGSSEAERGCRGPTRGAFASALALLGSAAAFLAVAACDMRSGGATAADMGWKAELAHFYASPRIGPDDLDKLGLAWEFKDFVVRGRTHRGVESTPVVVGRTMYFTGPWSVVYAVDAVTGEPRWTYDPEVEGQWVRKACCDAVNRGVAVEDGVVYVGTLDGHLVALDAGSGKVRWKVDTLTDRTRSYTITGAPRVAGRNVLIGNGGAELGVRGYVSAYDRTTGRLAWRFYAVPGDPAKGDEHPEMAVARKTWDPKSAWELGGGGTPWDSIVYDPETKILYVGTGNGGPHPVWSRSPAGGDNLYLASILAIDAGTGRLRWRYQTTPRDSWDYTATQNMILADLKVGGRDRKVIMQAPKNGFFYVLDRVTGELLSAEKYTTVTWAERVDIKTGRPVFTAQSDFSRQPKLIWPSEAGGHNWQPMAYSPTTGLVYIPVLEAPMIYRMKPTPYRPASIVEGTADEFPNVPAKGEDVSRDPLLGGQPRPVYQSVLKAWNPSTGKVVWSSAPMPYWSGGAMALDNGMVVQGSSDGRLTFYDGRSGKVLRRIQIGTGIMAAPMTYVVAGEQYVAVNAGFGGADLSEYEPGSAALRFENSERLLVFKVGGGTVPMPPPALTAPYTVAPARYRGDRAAVARGDALYSANCARCHGGRDTNGGYPNLWKISPEVHDAFKQILLEGVLSDAGMARFSDVLGDRDVTDIHAYLSEPEREPARRTGKAFH